MAFLFSALNISGTCKIENIGIECKNCRYAIHDEASSLAQYAEFTHEYIGVRCKKTIGAYRPTYQVYGGGLGKRTKVSFKDCVFLSEDEQIFSTHTNALGVNDGNQILIDGCVFANFTETPESRAKDIIQFITGNQSTADKTRHNTVIMNNCYVGGKIALTCDANSTTYVQAFDLVAVGNNDNGVTVAENFASNPYPPRTY